LPCALADERPGSPACCSRGVFIELSDSICRLALLENGLRRAAGESGYAGDFLA
jgi:hypothetical protein